MKSRTREMKCNHSIIRCSRLYLCIPIQSIEAMTHHLYFNEKNTYSRYARNPYTFYPYDCRKVCFLILNCNYNVYILTIEGIGI